MTRSREELEHELARMAGEVERLERANRSLQAVFDAIADPIFVKDDQHRWVFFNQAFTRFLGHPPEALMNTSDYAFFPREQADVFWQVDEEVLRTGTPNTNEERLTDAEGQEHVIVTKKTLSVGQDGSKQIVGVIRDVTEQKQAEESLRLHQDLALNLMEGLFAFHLEDPADDHTLRMITTNPAAQRQAGVDFTPDVGRPLHEILPGLEALGILQAIADVARGTLPGLEDEVVYADDRIKPATFAFKIFPLPGGCVGGTFVDVTERRRIEAENARQMAELEEANRRLQASERYKDEFFSVVSHELRTPLNFVIGFASILEDEVSGPLTANQHAEVAKILVGAERMLELVSNLLDMSRIQAGRLDIHVHPTRYGPLRDEVAELLAPLAAEKGLTVVSDGEADAEVMVDPNRVAQVLTNLLGNAIKFTPRGGRLTTRSYVSDTMLVAEVSDTGPGLAPEQMSQLFRRFQQVDMSATRQAGGTGLGLAISKAIVEAHGGEIGVRSTPGQGSTFWLTLPLVRTAASAPAAGSS